MFRRYASLEAVDDDLKIVRIACPAQRYNNNKINGKHGSRGKTLSDIRCKKSKNPTPIENEQMGQS
jgi:hypothetical protein